MRKAFSMLMAIATIVVVSIISALVLNLSGKMVKSTVINYRKQQAIFLARSYTELAIMSIINYDRNVNNDCIEDIDGVVNNIDPDKSASTSGANIVNGGGYRVNTRIYYLGNSLPCSSSRILNDSNITTDYADGNSTTNGAVAAVIIDVYVRYPDGNSIITYHNRTLQKI